MKAKPTSASRAAAKPEPAAQGSADPAAEPAADLLKLQRKLKYEFRRPELLELALTHRSHTYEARHGVPVLVLPAHPEQRDQRNAPGSDNEQLEFLGDAVLGLVITEALFREFPHCSEGELTRLRANLVSRKRMAEMGAVLGLGEALRLGKSAELNGGRRKPALLANAAEAVLAAVYLDAGGRGPEAAGRGLDAVRKIAARYLVQPELEAMRQALASDTSRGAMRDHKTLLQERVQASGAGRLRYADIAANGPAHLRSFLVEAQLQNAEGVVRVLASAEGPSKKEAQQRAAELALAQWPAEPPLSTAARESGA